MRLLLYAPLQVFLQALAGTWLRNTCTPDVQVVMRDSCGQQKKQGAIAGIGDYLPPPAAFPLMLVGQNCFGAGLTPNRHIPLLVQLVCGHTLQDRPQLQNML